MVDFRSSHAGAPETFNKKTLRDQKQIRTDLLLASYVEVCNLEVFSNYHKCNVTTFDFQEMSDVIFSKCCSIRITCV